MLFLHLEPLLSSCRWVSCFRALYFFFTIVFCFFCFCFSYLFLFSHCCEGSSPFLLFHFLALFFGFSLPPFATSSLSFAIVAAAVNPLLSLSPLFTTTVAFTHKVDGVLIFVKYFLVLLICLFIIICIFF